MALALAFDDVKTKRSWHEIPNSGGGATRTPFFGSRDQPDFPHATLNQPDTGLCSSAHFHRVDQFQVVVDGKGQLGRHRVSPYSVHFARAYTPYGPLRSDDGLTFFVMRTHFDAGSQHLPAERDQLQRVANRQPWQITRQVTFPALEPGAKTVDVMLQAVPGMTDQRGLAAYAMSMKPNAQASAPDPSHGDGQYLIVTKGSLLHDQKEHKALALLFVSPKEQPLQIRAGLQGMEGLILNFPRPQISATSASKVARAAPGFKTWQCLLCAFVYDEAAGLPEEGIAPGTRWQDVPETWNCPDCSASKADFEMIEIGN